PAHDKAIDASTLCLIDLCGGDVRVTRVVGADRRAVRQNVVLPVPGHRPAPEAHIERPYLLAGLCGCRLWRLHEHRSYKHQCEYQEKPSFECHRPMLCSFVRFC